MTTVILATDRSMEYRNFPFATIRLKRCFNEFGAGSILRELVSKIDGVKSVEISLTRDSIGLTVTYDLPNPVGDFLERKKEEIGVAFEYSVEKAENLMHEVLIERERIAEGLV